MLGPVLGLLGVCVSHSTNMTLGIFWISEIITLNPRTRIFIVTCISNLLFRKISFNFKINYEEFGHFITV
jgi:hypothetical protein